MRTLILLDLLGAKNPSLTWQFENTRDLFHRMQSIETRLRDAGVLQGSGGSPKDGTKSEQARPYLSVRLMCVCMKPLVCIWPSHVCKCCWYSAHVFMDSLRFIFMCARLF